ncbi:hypothetical protein [Thalassospira sp.]|uniref:hypothetical protein n=1 Tax=Thalassospira sp. TaxID=1912094 RepID=UPI001B2E1680|nr:hypothetical protein [Thalassospira sp.]MBO6522111.1 hypothetical protein [Rhodospirillales bacterium]MBO6773775.1 hypothetical protein [Thalassospira sp.]
MISLKQPSEPFDIELPYGVTVTVKPLTTAGMAAAQALARRRVEALEFQHKEMTEAGLPVDGLPDFADKAEHDGVFQDLLIKELAVRHITTWSGIEDDPDVTPENISAVMSLYPVGERFFQEFTLKQVLLTAAKNGSGLSAAGTSSQAEGPATAKPAKRAAAKSAQDADTP